MDLVVNNFIVLGNDGKQRQIEELESGEYYFSNYPEIERFELDLQNLPNWFPKNVLKNQK